ncbi:hypothetical protein [Coralliovum pocilloporae]|uniref:hypothetical protein n=1 Tax=Coralliovum pocilloporae TaxID=3066369 RepID=UPI003307ACEB
MLAGHYATALIAHQKYPSGTLLFFLLVSQFQDLLWLIFHYLGLEPTSPENALDVTISNIAVDMVYSHDLLPQALWAGIAYLIGRFIFRSNVIGLLALALVMGHFILDFFSGFPHHVFGEDTHQVGLGLYESNAYLAVLIEAVLVIAALWYYFAQETAAGIRRSLRNRMVIIGAFVYAILFMAMTATLSLRDRFGIPEFDPGFNTSIPTLAITYLGLIWILYRAVSQKD